MSEQEKTAIIFAERLALAYNNEVIINNANFKIFHGDFVYLTGASGSGKTTILKSIYGDLKPHDGNLLVGGYDMNKMSNLKLSKFRQYVSMIFQDYKLIQEWSIEKNIELPLVIKGNLPQDQVQFKVQRMLKEINLLNKKDKHPYQLSGGEQQRVAIARAIIHSPALILADEPTGNLDDESAATVLNLLKMANEAGTTIIMATHHYQIINSLDVNYRNLKIEGGQIYEIS